ncbi:MAG TPA: hypothetical protein VFJ71_01970 [Candidatus Limnocylindrales bacterium]|nr:hypothetical protein [Candidatus Limnocylindrales bacterium]
MTVDKVKRMPHEQMTGDQNDGLGAEHDARPDVEGHLAPGMPGTGGDSLAPGMPGTGGDSLRRPVGGGELEDDVEGHLAPGMPGTGGDQLRRPAGGGELDPGMPGTGGDSLRRPVGGGELR